MRGYLLPKTLSLTIVFSGLTMQALPPDSEGILSEPLPDRWIYNEHFNQSVPTDDGWWQSFDDSLLDSLIAEGVANNYDVMMAFRRIEIARQAVNSARAGYFPTLGATAGWTAQQSSGATLIGVGKSTRLDYLSLGLTMSWELDVFGRVSTAVKQKGAAYRAGRAEYAATMTSLCSNIAKTYLTLRMYQAEYAVAVEHIESQGKIVRIVEARQQAGLASALDVAQAKIVYYSTQASLPALVSSIHTSINALATLLAVYPDDIYHRLSEPTAMPDFRQIVPVGVPADLLRRRPDVVQAEYEVAAYAAAIGVAKKDFLPVLTLNGSIGSSAHRFDEILKHGSLTYAVTPTLTWTVFDGFARRANVVSAREQYQIGVENYNLTVMTAVQEVDNAYSAYLSALKSIDVLTDVVAQSRKALDLSLDLYKSDLNPFSDVVTAQMSLLEYQNSLVTSQGQALTALVALYQALGGGWNVETMN